jgi:hypothetical protein
MKWRLAFSFTLIISIAGALAFGFWRAVVVGHREDSSVQ